MMQIVKEALRLERLTHVSKNAPKYRRRLWALLQVMTAKASQQYLDELRGKDHA